MLIKMNKFTCAYIISRINPYDVIGISPQCFTASEVKERLNELINQSEKNRNIYNQFSK